MIFVTGGTGFIGRILIRKLLAGGKPLRVLYRNERRRFMESPRLTWIEGKIGDPASLCRGMEGAEGAIHLAGVLIEPGEETFEKIHVEGTRNVLEAARRSGVRRLLYMSGLGARPAAASRYHQTKWKAEEEVRASGLLTTIFRPSLVYGKEDASLNFFAGAASRFPVVPVPGRGENRLQPVWVDDVAESFVRSVDRPVSYGKTYPLCGPRVYTFNELIDLILRIKKKRRLKLHIPIGLLRGPAALGERLFRRPPLTRDQLVMLREDNVCSDDKAGFDLGMSFKGLEEILPTYLK